MRKTRGRLYVICIYMKPGTFLCCGTFVSVFFLRLTKIKKKMIVKKKKDFIGKENWWFKKKAPSRYFYALIHVITWYKPRRSCNGRCNVREIDFFWFCWIYSPSNPWRHLKHVPLHRSIILAAHWIFLELTGCQLHRYEFFNSSSLCFSIRTRVKIRSLVRMVFFLIFSPKNPWSPLKI